MDKPKFNLLDGVIILVIALVVAVGVYFIKSMGNTGEVVVQNTVAEFKVQFTKMDESVYKKFEAQMLDNESVWIGVKERFEGMLSNVEIAPAQKITTDTRNGKAVMGKDPSLYDITLTIRADAVETNSAVSASGTAIRVGEEVAVRGKGVAGFGFVVDLKTIAE